MQNYNNNELKMIYYKFHIYYAKQFWKCGNPFLKRARGGGGHSGFGKHANIAPT